MNNLWIKKLEVINFQKHSHFVADFISGINVIYGNSDEGKSCLIRAIKWIFFNEPKGDVVRKEGTKKTSVKITLSNDIIVEKVKSSSINRYIIYRDDKTEEYNAIGKGELPEEIKQVLKLTLIDVDKDTINLNIADQISLPFLCDKSAIFRMKLFNKFTGNDIIDKVFQAYNKDLLQINREEKIEQTYLNDYKKSLETTTNELDTIKKLYQEFSTKHNSLKDQYEHYKLLTDSKEKFSTISDNLITCSDNLSQIKLISPDKLIELNKIFKKYETIYKLYLELNQINQQIETIEGNLQEITIPAIDIKTLENSAEKLNKLIKLQSQLKELNNEEQSLIETLNQVNKRIEKLNADHKEMLKQCKVCPICKTELTEDKIKEINL